MGTEGFIIPVFSTLYVLKMYNKLLKMLKIQNEKLVYKF